MKTEEGNKLIDDFMGLTQEERSIVTTHKDPMGGEPILIERLGYHVSWDRIMPVVEKIVNENSSCCHFSGLGYIYDDKISFSMLDDCMNAIQINTEESWISAVWLGAVEYIQWYNKNKKE